MKSYRCTTALAVLVFNGILSQHAYAKPPGFATLPDGGAKDNGKPMLRLSTTLTQFLAFDQAGPQIPDSDPIQLKLAMTTDIAGTFSAGASGSVEQSASGNSTESQTLLEKYYQGAYSEVGKEGMALLEKEPHNTTLRFAVANSLAWTGFTALAAQQYEALSGTQYHDKALIALAHVNRWSGRPDLAAQAYRRALEKDPDNVDALSGLLLANRELRPATAARIGRAGNSDNSERTWTTVSHAWRNESGATRHEITIGRIEESNPQINLVQRDLSWRYDDLDGWLAQAELSVQESPSARLFGAITVKPVNTPLQIHIGRINWGKLAFNPQALQSGLTANRIGGDFNSRHELGNIRVAYNAYRISDSNLVHDASAQITPAMQPFSSRHLRGYIGIEARKSRFNDSRYWSPEKGQYTALVGVSADWSNQWWQTSGVVQYGMPLTGESGRSWSAGLGAKHWLGKDWAVSAEVWAIHTPRDGGYRGHSGSIRIEKLW